MQNFERSITEDIKKAISSLGFQVEDVILTPTKEGIQGDICTSIACQLSSQYKKDTPQNIAQEITKKLEKNNYISIVTAEPNGFINITLNNRVFNEYYSSLLNPQENKVFKSWKFLEVISANPTGYLHIGHTRHGILTDTLGNIFERVGYSVRREYLVNDSGNQIKELIRSFWTIWSNKAEKGPKVVEIESLPYHGPDMIECVKTLWNDPSLNWHVEEDDVYESKEYPSIKKEVIKYFLYKIKLLTEKYNIQIDHWRPESTFVTAESLSEVLRELDNRVTYEKKAYWVDLSKDMDGTQKEVLIKSDGSHTYFMQDIIYHSIKLNMIGSRDEIVDILGSDHYGHGDKLMAYLKTRGNDDHKKVIIQYMQLVKLISNGEALKMSKRDSTVIFMKDLDKFMTYEEVRWFFIAQPSTTTLEIDLNKLKNKDYNNQVYYVMYAYSRISKIFKKLENQDYLKEDISFENLTPQERSIFNLLLNYESTLISCSNTYSPHKLPQYLYKIAQLFHSYYETTNVLTSPEHLLPARLALLESIRRIIKEGLSLMRITAKEKL